MRSTFVVLALTMLALNCNKAKDPPEPAYWDCKEGYYGRFCDSMVGFAYVGNWWLRDSSVLEYHWSGGKDTFEYIDTLIPIRIFDTLVLPDTVPRFFIDNFWGGGERLMINTPQIDTIELYGVPDYKGRRVFTQSPIILCKSNNYSAYNYRGISNGPNGIKSARTYLYITLTRR